MDPLILRMDHLEVQLARLRNQNRRLRRVLLLGALVGFFFLRAFAATDKPPAEVKAEKFVIVTSAGITRATLQARTDGKSGLEVRDGNRRVIFELPLAKE